MISDKALQDFAAIWREEVGEEISEAEIAEQAIAMLVVFDSVYRPIKKEWKNSKVPL